MSSVRDVTAIQLVLGAILTACAGAVPPVALARPVTVDPAPVVHPVPTLLAAPEPGARADRAVPSATTALIEALGADPATARPEIIAALETVLTRGASLPETDRARLTPALLDTLRTAAPGTRGDDLRVPAMRALGAIRALDAVSPIAAHLLQPLPASTAATARAAADALGEIGDPRGVDALVDALLLDATAPDVAPSCLRALARMGARHAVPALVATLEGRNADVARHLAAAHATPGAVALPDGFVQITMADALGRFAAESGIDPLLAMLSDRARPADVRVAAADALAKTAAAIPAARPRIIEAIVRVLDEPISRDDRPWLAPPMAAALARIGDSAAISPILHAIRNPLMTAPIHATVRARLLHAYAILARHRDVAAFTPLAARLRTQISAIERRRPSADAVPHPPLATLERLQRVIAVVRTCRDGDLACYQRSIDDGDSDVSGKAALLAAWTAAPDERSQVRERLLTRLERADFSLRSALFTALESVAGTDCADCVTRLEALIEAVPSANVPAPWQLDAWFLVGRWRSRGVAAAASMPLPTP